MAFTSCRWPQARHWYDQGGSRQRHSTLFRGLAWTHGRACGSLVFFQVRGYLAILARVERSGAGEFGPGSLARCAPGNLEAYAGPWPSLAPLRQVAQRIVIHLPACPHARSRASRALLECCLSMGASATAASRDTYTALSFRQTITLYLNTRVHLQHHKHP